MSRFVNSYKFDGVPAEEMEKQLRNLVDQLEIILNGISDLNTDKRSKILTLAQYNKLKDAGLI